MLSISNRLWTFVLGLVLGLAALTVNAASFAYIANYDSNTVSVIDTSTNNVIATIPVGIAPNGVAVNPAGTFVYVTNVADNTVSVINTATNTVDATVSVGLEPRGVAVNPTGTFVYVLNASGWTVSVINTATNAVVATVSLGARALGIAVNPAGTLAYISNINGNTVSVFSTATNTVDATVTVGPNPFGVAVNLAGTFAYVANSGNNTVSVISTATNAVVATVAVGQVPYGISVNPAGTLAYVTNVADNTVSVINTATNTVDATVSVGTRPQGVAFNPAGTLAYVANMVDNTVSVINTATNTVDTTVTVGLWPDMFGNFIGPSIVGSASVPDAPTVATATGGNAQATVSFTAPASNGGSAITGYTVTSIPAGGVDSNAGTTALTHIITGLTNGTAYTFTVTATNAAGTGAVSAASNSVTPSAPAANVPGAPSIGTATGGNAQATVSFTTPISNGGSAITGYTVTSNPAGGVDSNAGTTALTHTITGLTNGTTYTFTVTATNAAGTGAPSAPSNSVTPSAPAAMSLTSPAFANNGVIANVFAFSAGSQCSGSNLSPPLTIANIPVGTQSLALTVIDTDGGNWVHWKAWNIPASTTSLSVNASATASFNQAVNDFGTIGYGGPCPPTPIHHYVFTLYALNTTFVTAPSTTQLQGASLGTATLTGVRSPSDTVKASQTISFGSAPAVAIGGTGTVSAAASSTLAVSFSSTTSNVCTVSGSTVTVVTSGTCTIAANQSGNANYNAATQVTQNITVAANTPPGAPTIATATAGNAQATVSFTAPASNGGTPITGYTVTSNPAGGVDSNAGTTALTHTITGLTNGTAYTFTVTATNSAGTGAASAASNSVTPIVGSPNGILSLTTTSASVSETGPTVTLTVQRTGGSTGIITLPWSTSNGSAVAGTDYGTLNNAAQKSGTLTWAAGDTLPKTITIGLATANIPVINNTAVDGSRTLTVNLGTPTGSAVLGANTSATVTINDNDSTVAMASPTATVAENGGNLILTVTRTGSIGTAASTTWSTVNGTALAGTHFGTAASLLQKTGALSWAAGDGAAKTITIPIFNVPAAQGDKTFTVNLVTATGATLSSSKSATITITDQTRNLALAATAVPVNEGAGNATLTVNRSGIASGAVSVNYTTANGTATAGQDYTATTGTLTWADGDTAPKTISVPITDDTLVEPAETLTVTLSAPTGGATITGLAKATVTIADNDSNLQFSVPAASVSEKLAGILLTVTRTGSTSAPATVAWTATDGSATAGADYGTPGSAILPGGTLSFAAGVMSQTLSIPILPDTLFEGNETFTVALSGPTNATLGVNSQVTVTIQDDEAGIQFEAAGYTVVEGTPNVVLKVVRTGPAATAAQTVKWTAANAEAIAGADYGAAGNATLPGGTLSWAIGDATAKTITIPVNNDGIAEGDETFTVTLSNLTGGLAFGALTTSTVTIWDNDSPAESIVDFSQAKTRVAENAGNVQLTVTRSGDATRPATVKWTASNDTALAGQDYGTRGSVALPGGTLSWAAYDNAAKVITLPILDDVVAESTETFNVTLSAPSVSVGIDIPKAAVVIDDDDEAFPLDGKLSGNWSIPDAVPAAPGVPAVPGFGWHVAESAAAAEGKYVLMTDTIYDTEKAQIRVAGDFLAGSVSFKLKVSSEKGFDFLRFYIDGTKMGEWSGNQTVNWVLTPAYPLAAGSHALTWSYEKDGNVSIGSDAAWVDSVAMPAMVVPQ